MKNDIETHMYIKSLSKIVTNLDEEMKAKDEEIAKLKKQQRDVEYTLWIIMVILIIVIGVSQW